MSLDVASEIHWQAFQNSLFINSSSCTPSMLIISSNALLHFKRQLPVTHPSLRISLESPPLFESYTAGLEISLSNINKYRFKKLVQKFLKHNNLARTQGFLSMDKLTCIFPISNPKRINETIPTIMA